MDTSSDTDDKGESADETMPITQEEIDAMDWDDLARRAAERLDNEGEDDSNTVNGPRVKRLRRVMNKQAIRQCLSDLQRKTEGLPWIETLTVTTGEFPIDGEDEWTMKDGGYRKPKDVESLKNNDIKREIYFYQSTLSAVKGALSKLKGEPGGEDMIQRPKDYYAEMIKTDDHMRKIKGRILWEQKKMGIVENRKRNQRLKGFHKEMMSQKKQQEARERRAEMMQIQNWRNGDDKDPRTLQQILKDAKADYANRLKAGKKKKPNMKRILKDLKYDGGKYRLKGKAKMQNTRMSTNMFLKDFHSNPAHQSSAYKQKKRNAARKRTAGDNGDGGGGGRGGWRGRGRGRGRGR